MQENIIIYPSRLKGEIEIIPSKSISHRMLICAALAGKSTVRNIAFSKDIKATIGCLKALNKNSFEIISKESIETDSEYKNNDLFCNESGATLRLMLPLALNGEKIHFFGSKRLFERPLSVYTDIFERQGIKYNLEQGGLWVEGKLQPDEFYIPGNISSQFISGLLFALPTLKSDSKIILTSPLQSKSYVDLTIDALNKFGVEIIWDDESTILVKGNQSYRPSDVYVEGDFSHAAFYLVGGALGDGIKCTNINPNSIQGDKAVLNILQDMGAKIIIEENSITAYHSELKAVDIDAAQISDIIPILSVAALNAQGQTSIYNAQRLRLKECDRLHAIVKEFQAMGGDIEEFPDKIIIRKSILTGGKTSAHNDHRMAMSIAIAAATAQKKTYLCGAQNVAKSAPKFWDEYKQIGGKFSEQ